MNTQTQINVMTITEDMLMSMADHMAAAASSFSAHGYNMFVQSREQFRDTLHKHYMELIETTINPIKVKV